MPRPKRADEKNAIYHALNRGNGRSTLFHKDGDYEAFENILAEGLLRYPCKILAYQLMPHHWHFVLQPTSRAKGVRTEWHCRFLRKDLRLTRRLSVRP